MGWPSRRSFYLQSGGPVEHTAIINTVRFDRPHIMVERLLTAPELDELTTSIANLIEDLKQIVLALDPTFPVRS
jgi:hypothetical protein